MTQHYGTPVARTNARWTRVILSDQHVREETLRALARAWVEDPAAVAEHLGLLAETADHADAFPAACLDAESDLDLGDAEIELRRCDAQSLRNQLDRAIERLDRTTPHLSSVPTQDRRTA